MADLWPIFSWLFTKGRCRYCGDKIAPRYMWVEIATGLIWAGIWHQTLVAQTLPAEAFVYAAAASTLVAIIFIDWEFYIIPDQINAFLWFVGIAYNVWLYASGSPLATTWGIPTALAGWLTGVVVLWGIALLGRVLFGKDAMGHGDIKMARGIGAVLGPIPALISFGLAVVLGAVLGIVQILALKRKSHVPSNVEPQIAAMAPPQSDEPAAERSATESVAKPAPELEEEEYVPESIGSLVKCGLGYVFLIDIVGLFAPKLYENYFGEGPFETIEEDEYPIENTMIPFGPYLALGAILTVVFQRELLGWIDAYVKWVVGK